MIEESEANAIGRPGTSRRAATCCTSSADSDWPEDGRLGTRGEVEPDRAVASAASDRMRPCGRSRRVALEESDREETNDQDAQHDARSDLTVHSCRRVRIDLWVRNGVP